MTEAPPSGTVPYIDGLPERLFRVGPVEGDQSLTVGQMRTGPWTAGRSGEPCPGALGVLLDDVLGYAAVAARPPGCWAVSTEISASFGRPLATSGAALRFESRVAQVDAMGALVVGQATDEAGNLIAAGRERLRFVDWEPAALTPPEAMDPAAAAVAAAAREHAAADLAGAVARAGAAAADLLGATVIRHEGGLRLLLDPAPRLANPNGSLHGGIQFCAVEIASSLALETLEPAAAPLVTSSVSMTFVRPASLAGPVIIDAGVTHRSRTIGVTSVLVRDVTGKTSTIATVTAQAPAST